MLPFFGWGCDYRLGLQGWRSPAFFSCVFFWGGVVCVMKRSASSSSVCTTFLLFFATDSPLSGRLFLRARRFEASWSWEKSSSSSTGVGWYLLVCLALGWWWSSSSLSARALIPLTSRVDGRLLEVVAVGLLFFLPLSVDGELAAVEMSCIIKGNLTHDSLTRGTPITFTVDDAIQHLRQSSGQIQTEDSFAITFTSENLLLLGFWSAK